MPLPEKYKCKLLMPDAYGDGRTDRGINICPFHHSSNGGGIKQGRFTDMSLLYIP